MNGIRRLFLSYLILLFHIKSACSLCNLPTAWRGSWYQRGMNSLLEITIDHIQTKGHCQDVLPDEQYYFFADRTNRCTRCLLFIDRHPNLLQYRESECIDADEVSSVDSCPNMIAPDAPLYTLYRNHSKPQLCPIQPPFLLTKLIKDGSTCTQTSSYISECATDYQFRLHLTSCSSLHQPLDLQLMCVATWIEGFHTYFVARILSKHHHHQYACFYFNTKKKDFSALATFSLSMVTDDSCRDLNSKQLATVMTISSKNRGIDNELNISCNFPEDLGEYPWYSLNRTIQMSITSHDIELINEQAKETNQRFHCVQSSNSFNYRIRSFTNCHVKDECLRLNRRTSNVLELILTDCDDTQYNRTYIFTRKSNISTTCPISIGHLLLESNYHHHHHSLIFQKKIFQMSVGCDRKEKLMIYQTKKDPEDRALTQTDTCLASWQSLDLSTIFIIAQSVYSNASYCLSFQMHHSIVIRNNSHDCSFHHYDDDSSISIYSAKLLNPCSHTRRSFIDPILLFLPMVLFLSNKSR